MRRRPVEHSEERPNRRFTSTWLFDYGLTALVLIAMILVAYRYLWIYGKSNVWQGDGLTQHFPEIFFWNQWVRGFLADPAGGLALWSWNLGLGADIIGTLAFPIAGDPFALISLAFPMTRMEGALLAVYLVRTLGAGLASAAYFRVVGARPLAAAVGAVIYVFTTFLLFISLRHPYFVNAMVFLPLLLIAIERLVQRRGRWMVTIVVCLAAYANFYFFYILTAVSVLYYVARCAELSLQGRSWREIAVTTLQAGVHYLLGVLLAAPLLLPSATAVLQTARAGTRESLGLLYPGWVYEGFIAGLISAVPGPRWTHLGLSVLGVLGAVALFAFKRRGLALKAMIVAIPVLMCLPIAGSALNGFSFPSNRFVFSLALFVGAAAALRLSDRTPFSVREIRMMTVVLGGFTALVLAVVRPLEAWHVIPPLLGLATIIALSGEAAHADDDSGAVIAEGPSWLPEGWRASVPRWGAIALLVVNVAVNAAVLHSTEYKNVLATFVDRHTVLDGYEENIGMAARELDLEPLFRATNAQTVAYNSSMVQGFPGTSFYYSTMSAPLSDFRAELDIRPGWSQFAFDGFDDRIMPSALLGVKYYIAGEEDSWKVPYGFEFVARDDEAFVHRNNNVLPTGFVFHQVIDRADYLRLGPVDRQSAMLQGAVVDLRDAEGLPVITASRDAIEVPYRVAQTQDVDVDLDQGSIVRKTPNASIVLSVTPVPDAELYVQMTGIDNTVQLAEDLADPDSVAKRSRIDELRLANARRDLRQPTSIKTSYYAGGQGKTAGWHTPDSDYNWGHDSQLVNLGYSEDGHETVRIEPKESGTLTFDSLRVLAMPMEPYRRYVADLREDPMHDIKVGTDTISGTVTTDRDGILFLSIPYSPGWRATVDGRSTEVIRVNTGFSGVRVSPGTHRVELDYATPGLRTGLVAGGVGLALAAGLAVAYVVRRRRA